ncbi:SPFH domain-containing protein [Longivirga aurantiaca]|uniref:SPFH domain-containing protein n=1 Tax=Longivirga aurantiaca TaxID=1837743 RepID=A0ABW1T043_9ACTN
MTEERQVTPISGWVVLPVAVVLYVATPLLVWWSFVAGDVTAEGGAPVWPMFVAGLACLLLAIVTTVGFYTLQPNEARVLILFGSYRGTVRAPGFAWGNPFYANGSSGKQAASAAPLRKGKGDTEAAQLPSPPRRYKVSLRARTLNGDRLKVNDRRGNPVEIAAVVVWRVQDTAKAVFDVDDVDTYVATQSETSVRHLATRYPYDTGESSGDGEDEVTLRGNVDEVSDALRVELQERLAPAGVQVDQARLTHLAYAPEIAQAMLRRQQAEAVIAARRKIVTGAVSMVEMALADLADRGVVDLDAEHRASMVGNLMVVLCGESQVTPVLSAGTSMA